MRIGIIGGGQLGRMLAAAGRELGIPCTTLDPAQASPAAQVAPSIVGAYDDRRALVELSQRTDVITYEFENVPVESVRFLQERGATVLPPAASLETAQDRLAEKTLFAEIGLPVPAFAPVDDLASLDAAIEVTGLPAVLKTRRLGYDGKGQSILRSKELAAEAWRVVGEVPSILEAFVPFVRELSILGVRARDGEIRFWPLIQNVHRDGILRESLAPAPDVSPDARAGAERHAAALMERLDHVGVLAIELFDTGDDLLGNEFAPRVHNSGHWTIEGAVTSQFENHLRAIGGLPLGPTEARATSVMVNLLGGPYDPTGLGDLSGAHVHLYGKEPRPGRKVGHVTVVAEGPAATDRLLLQVRAFASDA
jgi:5-(carboxyamino)imidazole ribonucleotide synthase